MPICTRPRKMCNGDPTLLLQYRKWGWFSVLYVTLGLYSPYIDDGVWVPAVDPQWQLSLNTMGQSHMINLTGTEEMPVEEDLMLIPVGIIDVDDKYHVRKYLKQVLQKMWTLYREGYVR